MKKLTRQSLNDLAEMMPVVNEIQQKEFVGGEVFFSSAGTKFGKIGDSDEIRVVTNQEYDNILEFYDCHPNDSEGLRSVINQNSGESLATSDSRMNVYSYYANLYAQSASGLHLYSAPTNIRATAMENYTLKLNLTDPNGFNMLENELISTLQHEQKHFDQLGGLSDGRFPTGIEGIRIEKEAIEYQMSQPEYQSTSSSYKSQTEANYHFACAELERLS